MKRAENRILLWLIAVTGQKTMNASSPEQRDMHVGVMTMLAFHLDVCRWLDAEDEWALNLQYIRDGNKHLDWVMWRQARMAEAGVL